jgi:hypothetical protein
LCKNLKFVLSWSVRVGSEFHLVLISGSGSFLVLAPLLRQGPAQLPFGEERARVAAPEAFSRSNRAAVARWVFSFASSDFPPHRRRAFF